jgi:peptidyl-prolyl cis-trans isomerase A (cyclophilin A)
MAGLLLAACGKEPEKQPVASQPAPSAPAAKAPEAPAGTLYMTFQTSLGDIRCRLFEKEAPIAVEKVTTLAKNNFYDGLTFHRVIPDFMIQGGDPTGTGAGGARGPGFPFEDEFHPNLKFDVPGRLAMANRGPNTNDSQFFITEQPVPHLNRRHTILGDCSGLAVVRKIARTPRDPANDKPYKAVTIKKVVVERVPPSS